MNPAISPGLGHLKDERRLRAAASIACFVFSLSFGVSTVRAQSKPPAKPLAGYNAIVVEKVAIEKNPRTEKFPEGYDAALQRKLIEQLREKKLFAEVIDPLIEEAFKRYNAPAPPAERRIVLTTTIVDFDPGNRALRYAVGWGAGATKIKVRFVFRDPASGEQKLQAAAQGRFLGVISVVGSGRNHAITEASGDIADALIREIRKNR